MNNGKFVTSQREIANHLADTFETKVSQIRNSFEDKDEEAINILQRLCEKKTEVFNFKEVDQVQM